ncbi:MAG: hypothetical protein U0Q11_27170 [Vicinamibacterales bacterium]
MKRSTLAALSVCAVLMASPLFAQDGRPALAVETAEDARVKQVLHDATPRDVGEWSLDDESPLDGVRGFHSSTDAVLYPFTHEYHAHFRRRPPTSEADALRAAAGSEAGIRRVLEATECDLFLAVNDLESRFTAGETLRPLTLSNVSLGLTGSHETRVYWGPWRVASTAPVDDGRVDYVVTARRNTALPGSAIQGVMARFACGKQAADAILAALDTRALNGLVGQSLMPVVPMGKSPETPLARPAPGDNQISFTIEAEELPRRSVTLKPSRTGQFGYLRNNHPNPAVTEMAVTRILASEDDDFATKNKSGFLDVTIPFIRRTGTFDVQPEGISTISGGINCWDDCEWSFDAEQVTVTVTRYDAVNGFIEGTFSGKVKVGHRIARPDGTWSSGTIVDGVFKVHRQADRY